MQCNICNILIGDHVILKQLLEILILIKCPFLYQLPWRYFVVVWHVIATGRRTRSMLILFHLQLWQKLKGICSYFHLNQLQLAKSCVFFGQKMFRQLGLLACRNWSHQCKTWKPKIHVRRCNTSCLEHLL